MTIRHSMTRAIFVAATAIMISLPLVAQADSGSTSVQLITVSRIQESLEVPTEAEALYVRLQEASKRLCGSSRIRMTGSLDRLQENEECYQQTLRAAVERLDVPEVSALHRQ